MLHALCSADHLPRRKLLPRWLDGGESVCDGKLLSQWQLLQCHLRRGLLLLHAFFDTDYLPRRKLLPRRINRVQSVPIWEFLSHSRALCINSLPSR